MSGSVCWRPRGTPDAIVQRLNAELKTALATTEVRDFMARTGIEAVGSTPAEMDAYFREERDRWSKVGQGHRRQGRVNID